VAKSPVGELVDREGDGFLATVAFDRLDDPWAAEEQTAGEAGEEDGEHRDQLQGHSEQGQQDEDDEQDGDRQADPDPASSPLSAPRIPSSVPSSRPSLRPARKRLAKLGNGRSIQRRLTSRWLPSGAVTASPRAMVAISVGPLSLESVGFA
jgi:hypothetical protein